MTPRSGSGLFAALGQFDRLGIEGPSKELSIGAIPSLGGVHDGVWTAPRHASSLCRRLSPREASRCNPTVSRMWMPPIGASRAVRALRRLLIALESSLPAVLRQWWPPRLTSPAATQARYMVLFKPYMVLCSWERDAPCKNGRAPRTTLTNLELPAGLHNVGRLDRDSEGLLLLTDDGRFTHELLQHGHPKRYWALVRGTPGVEQLQAMARGGLHIRGRLTKPASVRRLSEAEAVAAAEALSSQVDPRHSAERRSSAEAQAAETVTEAEAEAQGELSDPPLPPHAGRECAETTWLEVVLHEGMNRQVRKMTKHAGHATLRLVRVGVGRLRLEDLGLRPGEWRAVARSDVL